MKQKITKAVFGCGRPCGLNLQCKLAYAENSPCRVSEFVSHEIIYRSAK
jgi:hypothetical protein